MGFPKLLPNDDPSRSILTLELLSKTLSIPRSNPILVPYSIPEMTPFREFRLWLILVISLSVLSS